MEMPAEYPPPDHVLRDLGVRMTTGEGGREVAIPLCPELQSDAGHVRAGVLAVLVDVYGGGAALEAVAPDWIATGDLAVHLLRPASDGEVRAVGRVLRAGRRTVVLEVEVHDRAELPLPVALATMTFSRLPRRDIQKFPSRDTQASTTFAQSGSGFRKPFFEQIGARVVDASRGVVEIDLHPYIGNTLRSIQGGVVAALSDEAAQQAARAAVAPDLVTTDLAVHYLELTRKGPVRSSARILRPGDHGALVRTELRDRGDDDRLLSVATVTLGRL